MKSLDKTVRVVCTDEGGAFFAQKQQYFCWDKSSKADENACANKGEENCMLPCLWMS